MSKDIDNIPSITLEQDDIASRHVDSRSSGSSAVTENSSIEGLKSGMSKAMLIALLLALLSFILIFIYLYKQQQVNHILLGTADVRIAQLESKLDVTDLSLTQSDAALAAKIQSMDTLIKDNQSEVRKLWGVAYDTNKKAIALNTQGRKQQAKTLAATEKRLQSVVKQAKTNEKTLNGVQSVVNSNTSLVKETAQRMAILQESLLVLEEQQDALKAAQAQFDRRIALTEDAIKSIDVHRRNVNDELRQIKEELRKRQPSSEAAF